MIVLSQNKKITGHFSVFEVAVGYEAEILGYQPAGRRFILGHYTQDRAKALLLDLHNKSMGCFEDYEMPES
jgi:hypothetical protein